MIDKDVCFAPRFPPSQPLCRSPESGHRFAEARMMAKLDGADSPDLEGDCGQQTFVQVDQIISAMRHCCYRHQKIATTSTSKRRGGSVSANLGAASTAGAISRAIRAIVPYALLGGKR